MGKHKKKQDGKKKSGKRVQHIKTLPDRQKHQKLEIKFDPEARRTYLTGFAKEKKERRIFGLAMGKIKERKLKLETRKEEREALKSQIEEAERNKRIDRGDYSSDDDNEDGEHDNIHTSTADLNNEKKEEMVTFQDEITEDLFGSHVVVTTSYGLPSSDEEGDEKEEESKKQHMRNNDRRQQYAGSVKKYIDKFTKQLPAKKKKTEHKGAKKGQHGASKMIGGSATDLKSAQKFLSKAQQNQKGKMGAEGKKRKKKR